MPLYEAEQARLGKANTLRSLGDLERRLGNVEAARQHYEAALPLYEAEQDPVGKINTFLSIARLERSLGRLTLASEFYQRALALADQFDAFRRHPVIEDARLEYQQMVAGEPEAAALSGMRQLAELLVGWLQTPDWAASESYLQAHRAELLTAEAESLLQLLLQQDPDQPVLTQHLAILRAARAEGIAVVYQQIQQILRENNSDA